MTNNTFQTELGTSQPRKKAGESLFYFDDERDIVPQPEASKSSAEVAMKVRSALAGPPGSSSRQLHNHHVPIPSSPFSPFPSSSFSIYLKLNPKAIKTLTLFTLFTPLLPFPY
jgi:hypothetical protein